jgi:hypothetical protein
MNAAECADEPACPHTLCRSEHGSLLAYFASGWSWVDLASNGLLAACTCLWWGLVGQQAQRYEVGRPPAARLSTGTASAA